MRPSVKIPSPNFDELCNIAHFPIQKLFEHPVWYEHESITEYKNLEVSELCKWEWTYLQTSKTGEGRAARAGGIFLSNVSSHFVSFLCYTTAVSTKFQIAFVSFELENDQENSTSTFGI